MTPEREAYWENSPYFKHQCSLTLDRIRTRALYEIRLLLYHGGKPEVQNLPYRLEIVLHDVETGSFVYITLKLVAEHILGTKNFSWISSKDLKRMRKLLETN